MVTRKPLFTSHQLAHTCVGMNTCPNMHTCPKNRMHMHGHVCPLPGLGPCYHGLIPGPLPTPGLFPPLGNNPPLPQVKPSMLRIRSAYLWVWVGVGLPAHGQACACCFTWGKCAPLSWRFLGKGRGALTRHPDPTPARPLWGPGTVPVSFLGGISLRGPCLGNESPLP